MKKYVDIENIRETDVMLNGEITRFNNIKGFNVGDIISVTCKIDGSNASATYDRDSNEIKCFSRNKELTGIDGLNGFKAYIMTLDPNIFKEVPNYVVFGEWMGNSSKQNKISYDRQFGWVLYSIWDKDTEHWLEQDVVKEFCNKNGFEYIEEFYYGPFISWEHCKSFMHSSKYGPTQEGIVIRNITEILKNKEETDQGKLDYINSHHNFIIKIVNSSFAESNLPKIKQIDPEKEQSKNEAEKRMLAIVTNNRVAKIICKCQIESLIPKEINESHISSLAKIIPKLVFNDVLKEEPEIVASCGEFAGKACNKITMLRIRQIILGT